MKFVYFGFLFKLFQDVSFRTHHFGNYFIFNWCKVVFRRYWKCWPVISNICFL